MDNSIQKNLYLALKLPFRASVQKVENSYKNLINKTRLTTIAYDILSKIESKRKYDKLTLNERVKFFKLIYKNDKIESLFENTECHEISTEDPKNDNVTINNDKLDIHLEIILSYTEIYNSTYKKIIYDRITINTTTYEKIISKCELTIPDIQSIMGVVRIEEMGNESCVDKNIIKGDLYIKFKMSKNDVISRINDYDLHLKINITLYELFNGIDKTIRVLDDTYYIRAKNCFTDMEINHAFYQYPFDGNKLQLVFPNKGLITNMGNRANLIISLLLHKDNDFNKLIKNIN